MAVEREKHILHDFFRLLYAYPDRENITEQRVAQLVEQRDHLRFEIRPRGREGGRRAHREREFDTIARFLKITEDVGGRRDTIMLPAPAFKDFLEALQRLVEFEAKL